MIRLILCSDLHGDPVKYECIADAAKRESSDLICCAGDMVDDASNRAGQTRYVADFIKGSKTPWAICSGNHDFDCDQDEALPVVPNWLHGIGEVEDGQTNLVGELVVTTIPWPVAEDVAYRRLVDKIVNAGMELSEKYQRLIIVHSPPNACRVGGGHISYRAELTTEIIEKAKPDFLLCGHLHAAVFCEYGSWCEMIEGTSEGFKALCFNAGQTEIGKPPQYVVLEIKNGGWKADHSHF